MKNVMSLAIIVSFICFGCSNDVNERNPFISPNYSIIGTYSIDESIEDSIRNKTYFKFGGSDSFAVFQYGFSVAQTDSSLQIYSENHGAFKISGDTIRFWCSYNFTNSKLDYKQLPINKAPFIKYMSGDVIINNISDSSFDFRWSETSKWIHAKQDTLLGIAL